MYKYFVWILFNLGNLSLNTQVSNQQSTVQLLNKIIKLQQDLVNKPKTCLLYPIWMLEDMKRRLRRKPLRNPLKLRCLQTIFDGYEIGLNNAIHANELRLSSAAGWEKVKCLSDLFIFKNVFDQKCFIKGYETGFFINMEKLSRNLPVHYMEDPYIRKEEIHRSVLNYFKKLQNIFNK